MTSRPPWSRCSRGRDRVEVTEIEGEQALAWAGGVDGWGSASPKPVFLYEGHH